MRNQIQQHLGLKHHRRLRQIVEVVGIARVRLLLQRHDRAPTPRATRVPEARVVDKRRRLHILRRLLDQRNRRPQLRPRHLPLWHRRGLAPNRRRLHLQVGEIPRVGLRPRLLMPLKLPLVADVGRFRLQRHRLHRRRDRVVKQPLRVLRGIDHPNPPTHAVDVLLATNHRNNRNIPTRPHLLRQHFRARNLVPPHPPTLRRFARLHRRRRHRLRHLIAPRRRQPALRVAIRHPLRLRALDDEILHHPHRRLAVIVLAHPLGRFIPDPHERVVHVRRCRRVGILPLELRRRDKPPDKRPFRVRPVRLLGIRVEIHPRLIQDALDHNLLIERLAAVLNGLRQHPVEPAPTLHGALKRPVPGQRRLRPHLDVPDQPLQHLRRRLRRRVTVRVDLYAQMRRPRLIDHQLHRLVQPRHRQHRTSRNRHAVHHLPATRRFHVVRPLLARIKAQIVPLPRPLLTLRLADQRKSLSCQRQHRVMPRGRVYAPSHDSPPFV